LRRGPSEGASVFRGAGGIAKAFEAAPANWLVVLGQIFGDDWPGVGSGIPEYFDISPYFSKDQSRKFPRTE
jgi:hypothetical protein